MKFMFLSCLSLAFAYSSLATFPLTVSTAQSAEVQPFDISTLIDERLKVQPAEQNAFADEATFLRRVSLDLVGRIPTISEVYQYEQEDSESKREHTVERLLDSGAFYRNLATMWRRIWVPQADTPEYSSVADEFELWVTQELQQRTPYDQLVRKIVTWSPDLASSAKLSPRGFYEANESNAANLAASTTRAFLGINLDCAQCHNHPFAQWSREQFWQTAAFFADFSVVDPDSKLPVINIPETSLTCLPVLLSQSKDVAWPAVVTSDALKQTLVDWMSAEQQRYMAKNAVNRLWANFFGHALVEPLDDLSGDAAQDGERAKLLNELSQLFIDSGYDIRLLVKSIVRSDAYRMNAHPSHEASTNEPRDALSNNQVVVRALSGEQLFDSLRTAAGLPIESGRSSRNRAADSRDAFVSRFYVERTHDAERSIAQALTMMNGAMVNQLSSLTGNRMLASIIDSPFMTADEKTDTLFVALLSRHATTEELEAVRQHFSNQSDQPLEKQLGELFWAIANSPEFNTNH